MSYQKQNFANGEVLGAQQLNHIEDGIVDVENATNASNSELKAEIVRAKAAEKANADNLASEVSRATGEEQRLDTAISTIIDPTLSVSGKAADAKAVGTIFDDVKTEKAEIDDSTVGLDAWSSKHIVDMLCPPLEETGNPVTCYPVAGYPLGCKVSWEPTQEGSGDPSPENIRPIKGRDSVTMERCGENLFTIGNFIGGYFIDDKYSGTHDFTNVNEAYWVSYKIPCNPGNIISVSGFPEKGGISNAWTSDINGKKYFKDAGSSAKVNNSYTTPVGARCLVIGVVGKLLDVDADYSTGMICVGASPTAYSPYTGQTATLTLPHTIYGGTVDAVTGEGQKTWKLIDSYTGEDLPGKWISDRDVYASGTAPTTGAQVAYKLAESISFTATGAQPIPALIGVNTILTDADKLTVTGKADPIKRITDLEDAVASMT